MEKKVKKINTLADWLETDDTACIEIAEKKYLNANGAGKLEDIRAFLARLTNNTECCDDYYNLISNILFIPGGRILSNRGMQKYNIKVTYNNCYVLEGPEDNIESIYEVAGKMARTFSYGGGVGIDISKLAPRNSKVNNSARFSTGAVSFCETYSCVAEGIGSKGRRAALMLCISDTHPDLEEFITHKSDLNKTTGANMSIKMSDAFFSKLKAKHDYDNLSEEEKKKSALSISWELSFYRPETKETIKKMVDPDYIMNLIAKTAWGYGEPGILYWDRVNNYCLLQHDPDFKFEATNPCGELPLPSGGACLLGALNLSKIFTKEFFKLSKLEKYDYMVNFFGNIVSCAVRYLNEMLEEGINLNPLPEQIETEKKYRPIGLGIMGLADVFINAGVKYGSADSIAISDEIGYYMAWYAIKTSNEIAMKKGAFPACKNELIVNSDFFKINITNNPHFSVYEKEELKANVIRYGLRNAQLLTIAPTGTTSTIVNVSGGIEPMFSTHYTRTTKTIKDKDKTYEVYPRVVKDYFNDHPEMQNDVTKLPDYFITARDITPKERIDVQSIWQTHIDNSISGTVNLPESATVEDVKQLYIYGYQKGLKGITVFRENCKRSAILNDVKNDDKKKNGNAEKAENTTSEDAQALKNNENIVDTNKDKEDNIELITREKLGKRLEGSTYYVRIGCGHLYITVNHDENNNLVEVFMSSSKSGGCSANAESLGRYASACLRAGMNIDTVVDITRGVKCPACTSLKGKGYNIDGLSCGDAMARVLKEEYDAIREKDKNNDDKISHEFSIVRSPITIPNCKGFTVPVVDGNSTQCAVTLANDVSDKWNYKEHTQDENLERGICPDCGNPLIHSEGCPKCYCGFSKC